MTDTLVVNEIYLSLQGESTFAGLPCVFVRLTACDLRCSYCDTAYAFTAGHKKALADIHAEIQRVAGPFSRTSVAAADRKLTALADDAGIPHAGFQKLPLVEFTGGEPLLQPNVLPLMEQLCDDGFTVLIETSGAHDISKIDPRVRRIMDLKCPSSGEVSRNLWENLPHLRASDEIKFVIGTAEDYAWTKEQITGRRLDTLCPLLVSWVSPLLPAQQETSLKKVPPGQTPLTRRQLAERIIADALPVRFQLQQHKFIWPPDQKGV